MASSTATGQAERCLNAADGVRTFRALAAAGFRRYATYRQATFAGAFTNTVFGFLRCYVLLAVAVGAATGRAAGYDQTQLATFVWVGQGLLAVVLLWGWTELADRIRSGDVVTDLLRPVPPVLAYLAADVGRAGHAVVGRLVPPVVVGFAFFDLYQPRRWQTGPLFVISVALALVISFACRYLVNSAAYWLHDARGPEVLWTLATGVLTGLYFPLRFLPDWLCAALWFGTPFPSLLQAPLDVLVERDAPGTQAGTVVLQAGWAAIALLGCAVVQRRAERRMVIQGG